MKNKVLTIMLIMLVAIALIGVLAVVVINKMNDTTTGTNSQPSIDEIVAASVDIPEMTTNLVGNEYIKISFTMQTDSKKAKDELEKRSFQAKNIIISELSEMKSEELTGKAGKEKLQDTIKKDINEFMQEGQVEQVYITSLILQ